MHANLHAWVASAVIRSQDMKATVTCLVLTQHSQLIC